MKVFNIEGKEYTLRWGMRASMDKNLVNRMFKIMTGSYIASSLNSENDSPMAAFLSGTADMVADIPETVLIAFHAGLQQYHKMDNEQSFELLEKYMEETNANFNTMFEEIKLAMEEDGFFDQSGLTKMIEQMNKSIQEETEAEEQKVVKMPKAPQDKKPKSKTGTK